MLALSLPRVASSRSRRVPFVQRHVVGLAAGRGVPGVHRRLIAAWMADDGGRSLLIIRNVQHVPACLTVDRIEVVTLETALRTGMQNLAALAEDGLRQAKKQGDADEHHGDGQEFA